MRRVLFLTLLLSACAAQMTDEEQIYVLVDRYGPRCGITTQDLTSNRQMSDEETDRTMKCMRALAIADQQRRPTTLDNLGYGMQGAGQILQSSPNTVRPLPRFDTQCYSDCLRRYSGQYCERNCAY